MKLKYLMTEQDKQQVGSHEQLQILGLMIAGIFHEIANPLSIVDMRVKMSVKSFSKANEIGTL